MSPPLNSRSAQQGGGESSWEGGLANTPPERAEIELLNARAQSQFTLQAGAVIPGATLQAW